MNPCHNRTVTRHPICIVNMFLCAILYLALNCSYARDVDGLRLEARVTMQGKKASLTFVNRSINPVFILLLNRDDLRLEAKSESFFEVACNKNKLLISEVAYPIRTALLAGSDGKSATAESFYTQEVFLPSFKHAVPSKAIRTLTITVKAIDIITLKRCNSFEDMQIAFANSKQTYHFVIPK